MTPDELAAARDRMILAATCRLTPEDEAQARAAQALSLLVLGDLPRLIAHVEDLETEVARARNQARTGARLLAAADAQCSRMIELLRDATTIIDSLLDQLNAYRHTDGLPPITVEAPWPTAT